jgi:hypothetical protein
MFIYNEQWNEMNTYRVYNGGDEGDNVSYNTQNPTGLSFLWQVISPTIIHSSICYELSSLRRGLILSIVYDIIPLCEGSLKDNPNTLRVSTASVP